MRITIPILIFLINLPLLAQEVKIITERKDDNSVEFSYTKEIPGSYFLELKFENLENTFQNTSVKKVIAHTSGYLFTLKPADKSRRIRFSYKYHYVMGVPNPKVNTQIVYALPFKTGKKIKIYEANSIEEKYFNQEHREDWKVYSVQTMQPDTVCAMRKGMVVRIENDYSHESKENISFTSKTNRVWVEHEDGTYALYDGFDKDKIFVKLGQQVYPQSSLGVLDKFNDKYRLTFYVYQYTQNLMEIRQSLKEKYNRIIYITPKFFLDNKTKEITPKEVYTVKFNEDLKIQEFTRREKIKFKKNPMDFQ